MSEDRVNENGADEQVENGELTENGWFSFTLSSVHSDYDIVGRMLVEGCDPGSLFRLANRQYGHVISNEGSSAGIARDEAKHPDLAAFLKAWRSAKRQSIVDGSYTTRQTGPRISEDEKEFRVLINREELIPRWVKAGNPENKFPTSPKADIQGRTLQELWDYCRNSPKYAHLVELAKQNVASAKAAAAAAKAKLASQPAAASTFADL